MKKERAKFSASTLCYVEKDGKILFVKFSGKNYGKYCAPGGKVEFGETPVEGIIREYREETGLTLIKPKLKGIVEWIQDTDSGLLYIYICEQYEGIFNPDEREGKYQWIEKDKVSLLDTWSMNKVFDKYVLNPAITYFETKFELDDKSQIVKEYEVYKYY